MLKDLSAKVLTSSSVHRLSLLATAPRCWRRPAALKVGTLEGALRTARVSSRSTFDGTVAGVAAIPKKQPMQAGAGSLNDHDYQFQPSRSRLAAPARGGETMFSTCLDEVSDHTVKCRMTASCAQPKECLVGGRMAVFLT
ncbi:hypothetical protein AB1N83_003914 [Pleurotus pulmonarius]